MYQPHPYIFLLIYWVCRFRDELRPTGISHCLEKLLNVCAFVCVSCACLCVCGYVWLHVYLVCESGVCICCVCGVCCVCLVCLEGTVVAGIRKEVEMRHLHTPARMSTQQLWPQRQMFWAEGVCVHRGWQGVTTAWRLWPAGTHAQLLPWWDLLRSHATSSVKQGCLMLPRLLSLPLWSSENLWIKTVFYEFV